MQRLIAISCFAVLISAFEVCGQDGHYRITTGREVVSECYGYSFRVPDGWNIIPNVAPLISTMSPSEIRGDELTPQGQAEMSFLPVPADARIVSISDALDHDKRAAYKHLLTTRSVHLPPSTGVEEAVAVGYDEDPENGEAFVRDSRIYMVFHGHVAAFMLSYRKGDARAAAYEQDLLTTLKSFGPLYGPSVPGGESKSCRQAGAAPSRAVGPPEHKITGDQAKALVMASLTAQQRQLPKVEAEPSDAPYSSRFLFFTVTWEGTPNGSVVVGNYAVDPYTGDVFSTTRECDEEKSNRLEVLQAQVRAKLHLSQSEYRRLKTKGPLCEQ